jgi:hypothetical protein
MKIKTTIWAIINLSVIALMIIYPQLIRTPIWLLILISQYLLRTKAEIKKKFRQEVPVTGVIAALLIPLVIVGLSIAHAVYDFDFLSGAEGWLAENQAIVRIVFAAIGILILLEFIRRMSKCSQSS